MESNGYTPAVSPLNGRNGSSDGSPLTEQILSGQAVRLAPALREKWRQDPALEIPGMPPNYGNYAIPHVMTLQGLVNNISRTYVVSDEALNDSFDNARFMENDVGLWECVEARIRASVLLDWHLEPEDQNDEQQVQCCDKLTKIIKACPRFTQVREQLMLAIWYGRSAVSFKYGWDWIGREAYVKPQKWFPVHGDKLVFRLNDGRSDHDPDQIGIRVGQTYKPGDKISKGTLDIYGNPSGQAWQVEPTDRGLAYFLTPAERRLMAVHKHQIQDSAFERPMDAGRVNGVGIRSRIYWEWFQKQNTLQWLMEYIERSAFGLELWYYPLGNEKARTDAETAVKNRTGPFRNVLFVPVPAEDGSGAGRQYGVDHVETGLAGADLLFNILDKYFGHRIKRLILGQILTSEAEATGLGGNLASIHLLTFRDIVKYDCGNHDETMTEDVVTPLKQWNFPDCNYFKVRFVTETEPVDADETLAAYEKAWQMGARIKERDVLDAIGASEPTPSDRILPSPGGRQAPGEGVPGAPANEKSEMGQQADDAFRQHPEAARAMGSDANDMDGGDTEKGIATPEQSGENTFYHNEFQESEHPRANDGRFGNKAGTHEKSAREGFTPVNRKLGTDEKTGKPKITNEFEHAEGKAIESNLHKRAQALKLPPAWTGVQINTDPKAPLQAVGFDSKGRLQYRYTAQNSEKNAAQKFRRVREFINKLPKIREKISDALHSGDGPDREAAAVLTLIDKTGFRVGSERETGADVKAHGASTLTADHVKIGGSKVRFEFIGKKGVNIVQEVDDPELSAMIRARMNKGGKLFDIDDTKIRKFLHKTAGAFKVKDFRTAVAADTVLKAMHDIPSPTNEKEFKAARLKVGEQVSSKLGNTPTVALASYIPPEVFSAWQANLQSYEHLSTQSATTTKGKAGKKKPAMTPMT